MNAKDIVNIASVAFGTATLTVMTFWSGSLDAGNESDALAVKIAKPKLVAKGVEMTLVAAAGRTFTAGDEPVFELQAVNTTPESANVEILIAMTATSPGDALRRMPVRPAMLWQHTQTLVLKPNEIKAFTISAQTTLPAKQLISVALQAVDPLKNTTPVANPQLQPVQSVATPPQAGVVAMTFSTATQAAQANLASAR